MDVCTIIAKNYVAHARVLARSFREHHPDGRFWVLVIDDYSGYLDPADEPFELLSPQDIGCEPFGRMAGRYDVLELATAVKPWLLRHLLATGSESITYLDPDIKVYGSLQHLDDLARVHGIVLTPHNAEPIPADGERPSQIDIMIAGVYNLGCLSIARGAETDRLLEWWSERLRRDCRVDPVYGYFVDQRWFDLVPGLVSDYAIVREPQFNVAYWNLHSREVTEDDGGYSVNGERLSFFHFSGFDPLEPLVLSRHQTRIDLSEQPTVAQLCREYADAVLAAEYRETHAWPYTWGRLASGEAFTRTLRRAWSAWEDADEAADTPFEPEGCERFVHWLSQEPQDAPSGINRALAEIHRRPDVRAVYPSLTGDSLVGFLEWASTSDDPELRLPAGLRPTLQAARKVEPTDPNAPRPRQAWGVNVVGYFRSELGTGEAARQVVGALDSVGVPVLPVHGATIPPNRQAHAFAHLGPEDAAFPVNLVCMNADGLREFAAQVGDAFFRDRHTIGLWFWEVTPFRDEWLDAFRPLDEVWLPTDHVSRAVSPVSPVPTMTVRVPVSLPDVRHMPRSALGLPEGFLFLFSFDYHSVFERKNPLAVVEAFVQSFAPGEGASLVLKCINEASDPVNHARLCSAAAQHPDVHVMPGYLSAADKDSLMAACDCYVSLHRSEGFGLTMAEAMYLGRPVIATGYSGNLDFMTPSNSLLVDHRLVPIGPDAAPYPSDGEWAQPDVEHAARLMRQVFADPGSAEELGRRAAAEIRRTHSPEAAGAIMRDRLAIIRRRLPAPAAPVVPPPASMPALAAALAQGPAPGGRSRFGPLGSLVRRLALRLMKPFTAYQDAVDRAIMGSLEGLAQQRSEVERELRSRDADAARTRAEMLAELRRHERLVAERVTGVHRRLGLLQSETRAIPFMEGEPFTRLRHPEAGRVQGYSTGGQQVGDGGAYRSFEDVFRGSEELIRARQGRYLALLAGRAPVLDLGCGRGEFLDLLREHGVPALGVDIDPGMVERCHQKGHAQVVLGDGVSYLESLEDGSLGAVFCAQVIEHLEGPMLVRLLALARRKLREDGIFVGETVNPHSPRALKTFWVDLTHQHPIFPEVALELCREAGFPAAFVFHPGGGGDFERDRFGEGEYAVVAGGASLLADEGAEAGDTTAGASNGAPVGRALYGSLATPSE